MDKSRARAADPERMSGRGLARFLAGRLWLNLKSSYEYRASFWSQVGFMMLNNLFLLWFWQIFFQRFDHVRDWNAQDMYILYGVTATAFGLANTFAGNAMELAGVVADGDLDYFISLPPPTLLHALVTRIRVSALGDLAFGLALLALVFHGRPLMFALAIAVCVPAALVFTSLAVLGASLSFYVGESRGITFQLVNLLMTFSTYPEAIFQGGMRWVLYLLVPAGFFSQLPARALHQGFSHPGALTLSLAQLLGGAAAFTLVSVLAFSRGLKRYTSGSAFGIRI